MTEPRPCRPSAQDLQGFPSHSESKAVGGEALRSLHPLQSHGLLSSPLPGCQRGLPLTTLLSPLTHHLLLGPSLTSHLTLRFISSLLHMYVCIFSLPLLECKLHKGKDLVLHHCSEPSMVPGTEKALLNICSMNE